MDDTTKLLELIEKLTEASEQLQQNQDDLTVKYQKMEAVLGLSSIALSITMSKLKTLEAKVQSLDTSKYN